MGTRSLLWWVLGVGALAGCFSAKQDYDSGTLACSPVGRECPSGYACALSPTLGDYRCYRAGQTPDGGSDAGSADGGCSDNQRRCQADGVTPEKCVGGQWQTLGACATACAAGDCVSCVPGTPRCSAANRPQKCNADGTGWEDEAPCPSDLPLCDTATGMCAGGCTVGDKRCNPSAPLIQQCDTQGIWRDTATTCPYLCSGSGATTACTGSCQPGARSCGADNTPLLCDATGSEAMQTPCPNLCTGAGECSGDCVPGATRCAAGSTTMVESCDATGHWGAATACTFVCDANTNRCGGVCTPGGPPQCAGNSIQSCDATGHFATVSACASTCSGGACRACTQGQKQCNGGKPQTCTAAGIWIDDQANACPFLCDAGSGTCTGECMPGSDLCGPNQVSMHCGANAMYTSTTCPEVCDPATGQCGGVCQPNSHRCSGHTAQICGMNGQWGSDTVCSFGCDMTTGQCDLCTDDPQATTCAGGKCGATMNNCGHTVQCPSSCAGTGESCGGGGVTGICGCRPEPASVTCAGGLKCGSVINNCGQPVACATSCTAPQTCGGAQPEVCGCSPIPMATACAGKTCGSASDGCGGSYSCGSCTAPQTCGGGTPSDPSQCGCSPMSAAQACGARTCGTVPDGCGGTIGCGALGGGCPAAMVCASGTCASTCTPLTACSAGKNCGTVDNGCGTGTLICGASCPAGQSCGGGNPGSANVCGCTPLGMATACSGKNCGSVGDGCGGSYSCGACSGLTSCGGGGSANVCGCTPVPAATACAAKNCGTVADGCGGSYTCGQCVPPSTCSGQGQPNLCGCTPLTATQACAAGQNCGSASNGCGGTVSCGSCSASQTCGGGGTPNQCGCTPLTSCPAGTNCGSIPNGCGTGTVTCGSATCGTGTGQQCGAVTANQCGCTRNPVATTCTGLCGSVVDNCGTTVSCGACGGSQVCASAASSAPNLCCTPESDATFCSRLGKNCGPVMAADNCGSMRTASCGTCAGVGQVCGASNVCGCTAETDVQFCARLGKSCGSVTATDNCGGARTVSCGSCTAPQVCETQTGATPNTCCAPETDAAMCTRLGKNCGSLTAADSCGSTRTISCGASCAGTGQTCGGGNPGTANLCGCTSETDPAFCSRLGKNCGAVAGTDNCGVARTAASCGACAAPQICETVAPLNLCCMPETDAQMCARLGKNCGTVSGTDNCGTARNLTSCGACTGTGQSCAGGSPSLANVCGCSETDAAFCTRLGKNCGSLVGVDKCGNSRTVQSCGSCAGTGQSCGGGGPPGVCGCTPESDASLCSGFGKNCGTFTAVDNCGGSRTVTSCGGCTGTQFCGGVTSNVCGGCMDSCANHAGVCGAFTDSCGVNRTCAGCPSGQVCLANSSCCAPESDAALCAQLGKNCGSASGIDNCGTARNIASCGTCPGLQYCGGNSAGIAGVCGGCQDPNPPTCDDAPSCPSTTLADACGHTTKCGANCPAHAACCPGGCAYVPPGGDCP